VGDRKIAYPTSTPVLPRTALEPELTRIDPAHTQQGPEVQGIPAQHIIVRHPAVTLVSPPRTPRIANQEGTGGFVVALGVLNLFVVIIAYGYDGMTPFGSFTDTGIGYVAGGIGVAEGRKAPEPEHRRHAGGQIAFYSSGISALSSV
jgi:hypothetical protein